MANLSFASDSYSLFTDSLFVSFRLERGREPLLSQSLNSKLQVIEPCPRARDFDHLRAAPLLYLDDGESFEPSALLRPIETKTNWRLT